MKLFSESTNIMKEAKKEENVDPNYKGEDLPFLIAEAVRTSMEVDGFVHKINTEADEFIMESAESKGIDLESASEERTSLIMEAAFGEGQGDGIIQKVIDFIKKMYRKVADFVKGILGRFQNVEKLLDKTVEDYALLMSKMEGVTVPAEAELKVKKTEVEAAAKTAKELFDINNLFSLVVNGQTYEKVGDSVRNLVEGQIKNIQKSGAADLASKIKDINTELGGNNNEASQHKLLTKYLVDVSGELPVKDDDVNETNVEKDPKKAVMDAAYDNETEEVKGGEIKTRASLFNTGLGTLEPSKLRAVISEGQKKFEEEAEEFDKQAQKMQDMTDKDSTEVDDEAVTELTGALNNYSSVVGVYTSVTTTVYTFAEQFVQEWLNRARAYAKDAQKVVEKEGEAKE